MDFTKLAPWNWFKDEEEEKTNIIPVKRDSSSSDYPASLYNIQSEFNRLFDSLSRNFEREWPGTALLKTDVFKPSLDIASDGKEYSINIELPGIDKSNITIEYTNDTLKIKGEKHQEKEEKEKDYYRMERSYGSFERTLNIPDDADKDNIESNYKDGVLTITIPRKALPQKEVKNIEIKD